MLQADATKVSQRAKKRGLPQLGTLGAGNHYAEIQVVDHIFDEFAASRMGIYERGQICIMIHSGSRGLGHQVATDSLVAMEKAMKRDGIMVNDRQVRFDLFAYYCRSYCPIYCLLMQNSWHARGSIPKKGKTTLKEWPPPQITPGLTEQA